MDGAMDWAGRQSTPTGTAAGGVSSWQKGALSLSWEDAKPSTGQVCIMGEATDPLVVTGGAPGA